VEGENLIRVSLTIFNRNTTISVSGVSQKIAGKLKGTRWNDAVNESTVPIKSSEILLLIPFPVNG
jgi:hypothetical protein